MRAAHLGVPDYVLPDFQAAELQSPPFPASRRMGGPAANPPTGDTLVWTIHGSSGGAFSGGPGQAGGTDYYQPQGKWGSGPQNNAAARETVATFATVDVTP